MNQQMNEERKSIEAGNADEGYLLLSPRTQHTRAFFYWCICRQLRMKTSRSWYILEVSFLAWISTCDGSCWLLGGNIDEKEKLACNLERELKLQQLK